MSSSLDEAVPAAAVPAKKDELLVVHVLSKICSGWEEHVVCVSGMKGP